ncbi:putative YhhN family protein [Blattamonas nauphoetae]|uniref:YhhN family protein n=1 Tax=Blattamonas nauphoetae TaxID=2049346 RepID=A0ABQ9XVW5_9EUKA|nr:putative YhhN family protein [Blattamonas nauphoetae]
MRWTVLVIILVYVLEVIFGLTYIVLVLNGVYPQNVPFKPWPVLLNIPLVLVLFDLDLSKRYNLRSGRKYARKVLHSVGLFCGGVGDVTFKVIPNSNFWFIFGAIFFLGGHLFYLMSYWPRKGFQSVQQLLINIFLLLVVIFGIFCVAFDNLAGDTFMKFGLWIYLAIEGSMVIFLATQPKDQNYCKNCRRIGIAGSILFFFSDVIIILNQGRKKRILFTDPLVMITYYLGQSLLAYGTRERTCFEMKQSKTQEYVNFGQESNSKYKSLNDDTTSADHIV